MSNPTALPSAPSTDRTRALSTAPDATTREAGLPSLASHRLQSFEELVERDRRSLRVAGCVALAFHAGLFAVTFPSLSSVEPAAAAQPKVYVMQPVRFKPPKPQPERRIPKPRALVLPIPDPTPDDPEPIYVPDPENFEIEWNDDFVVAIPEAPPAPPELDGPIHVTPGVDKPERISGSAPRYTEIARKARIQGVVRLEAIIDEHGHVIDIEVRSGLPMGLTEAAVEAARQWRYRPARLDGKPVAVYFNLAVQFELN